jgi:ABC-type amino acid transport substrate-binding protein
MQPHERSILEKPVLQANETKMTTNALADWQTVRSARLNELAMVIGPTDRLDLIEVLVMRLAAEWQGFVRQFHDEITALFVTRCGLSGTLAQVASGLITYRREIDVGNANADALANDLSAFGIDLWAALANEHSGTKNPRNKSAATIEQMKRTLTILNQARNAAAHDDETRRQKMRQAGIILSVATMMAWQNLLTELAEALDRAVTKQVEFPE